LQILVLPASSKPVEPSEGENISDHQSELLPQLAEEEQSDIPPTTGPSVRGVCRFKTAQVANVAPVP